MVIYVEYVLIDNLVINTLILLTCSELAKNKTTKLKIFLSSLTGTVFALLSPLFSSVCSLLLKPFIALLMVYIAFTPKKIKSFLILYLIFFISTFVFGGACFGICEMLGINLLYKNGIMYEYKFPIGLALLICSILYICLKNIIKYIFNRHSNDTLVYDIVIRNNNKELKISAFLDTGNCIQNSGKPVTIINYATFNKLSPNIPLQDIILNKDIDLKNSKYITISGLNENQQKLLIFSVDELEVNKHKTNNAILGLTLSNFSKNTHTDSIISKKILGDNK